MTREDKQSCLRCRISKRKCDKSRLSCIRCAQAGLSCNYDRQVNEDSVSSESYSDVANETDSFALLEITKPCSKSDRVIKKRDRACLSCTRCHRLKIKCDKQQPCTRCAKSGFGNTCIYTHRVKTNRKPPSSPFILAGEDPEFVVATWFLRKRGSSHFKALLNRLDSICALDSPPFVMAVREHLEGDCASDFSIPGNFPFGSTKSIPYASTEKVQELLWASRTQAEAYISYYFKVYHHYLPVVDASTFHTNVAKFTTTFQEADPSWLAQYLVVLGLGSYALNEDGETSNEFFYASEACLTKSPYMFRPTTTDISTLCLMVLAKKVAYATCWALDTSWTVMGIVVRLSMMMVLHQEWMPEFNEPAIVAERVLRRRLWTSVVFLDLQLSLITGQQSLLPLDIIGNGMEAEAPRTLEDCWDSIMPRSFTIICHFLNRVNSHTDQVTFDEVLQYDLEIRQLMRQQANLPGNKILRVTVDIFFRRVLLVLHRRHALDPDSPLLYSTSYWSSLECSLALIMHHRELTEPLDPSQKLHLIGRLYMLDFFASALTTSIHLLRSDAPLAATLIPEGMIPPRQTMLSTLLSCLELFSREQNNSLCFRTGYRLLTAVFKTIPKE